MTARGRTIREPGGEIWSELSAVPHGELGWQPGEAVLDIAWASSPRRPHSPADD